MHDRNWERVAGYAGLVAVLAFVVPGFVGMGTPPKPSDPDTVYKSYLVAHHAAIMRGVWLNGLGAVLVLWLGSGLRSTIRRHAAGESQLSTLVFGTFVLAAAQLCLAAAMTGGLVYKALPGASANTVRMISDTTSFITGETLGITTAVAAAMIAVTALAAKALPRPVGAISAVAAAVNFAGSLTIFSTRGFFSAEGAYTFVGLIVTMVWLISLSVALIRPAEATAPVTVASALPVA
jgi:hypothetical protein